ncbi:unnamed protein product [Rhizophagus irregularis]|nr:unnamed protein product [Rhizophagus irregularis]
MLHHVMEKGFKLYNEAARYNNNISILSFYDNDDEIFDDLEKVNYWYHKAAEDDNKIALYELGRIHESGIGVGIGTDIDKKLAFDLFELAAMEGNSDALECLALLYEQGAARKAIVGG